MQELPLSAYKEAVEKVFITICFYMCCCRWLSNNGLRQLPDELGDLAELQSL
jgi:hypothetical protein